MIKKPNLQLQIEEMMNESKHHNTDVLNDEYTMKLIKENIKQNIELVINKDKLRLGD